MIPGFGLWLLVSIALCVHVVRTHQEIWWIMIIVMLPGIGALIYLLAVILPAAAGGPSAQRFTAAARAQLDPHRDYREAAAAIQRTPTVQNRMRLAKAAAELGRHDEAERLYAEAAQGIHAEDPVLLLGRAQALLELNRPADALVILEKLGEDADNGRTPQAALALARAYDGLGRQTEAEGAYRWAVERLPGLEGMGRWAAFLARTGRAAEARDIITEMDQHIAQAAPQFRREYRGWRDIASRALAGG